MALCYTFSFNPFNNLPVNTALAWTASNFWGTSVAANYRRHAPPVKIQKGKENREKLLKCGTRRLLIGRTQPNYHWNASQPHLQPKGFEKWEHYFSDRK